MRLGEIRAAGPPSAAPTHSSAENASVEPSGHALVALKPVTAAPEPDTHERPAHYRQAPFLAQLIATKDQHPQTRERRRADPREAIAAYRAMAKLMA